jgi:hypothetical protein
VLGGEGLTVFAFETVPALIGLFLADACQVKNYPCHS